MKNRISIACLYTLLFLLLLHLAAQGQDSCKDPTEKIVGAKGATYLIPCQDMVILDIGTYSKYRYMEKQFHLMDSTVSGYTMRIDSLDGENQKNRALLEEKVKDKDDIIDKYKKNSQEITSVLEKCKEDSEGFAKVYQEKVEENRALNNKIHNLKRQRRGFLGVSAGLGILLVFVLL